MSEKDPLQQTASKDDFENELRQRHEKHRKKKSSGPTAHDSQSKNLLFELEGQREAATPKNQIFDLYEFAPVGCLTIDADNNVVNANRRGAEMLGYSKERLIGRPMDTYLHHEDLPVFRDLQHRAWQTEANPNCELRMVASRGVFDAELHARHLEEATPPLLQIAVLDISARKEAEDSLREANRLLEKRVHERTMALQNSRRELQYIAEYTIHLLERERRKISLDLHDTIAQGLATIKLLLENKLAMMDRETTPSPFSIEHILEIASRNLSETRRIMNYLRPKMLDEIGFLATLRWHWQEFERLHPDTVVHKDIRIAESDLPEELVLVVYRIIQEATHNIGRHSRAGRINFSLQHQANRLCLRIADNGAGFDPEMSIEAQSNAMGITCMKERAELSGGEFSMKSTEGQGTVVEVQWELDRWGLKRS